MFRLDLICLTNSGINAARITSVRPMMESTHEAPDSSPKSRPHRLCQAISTADTA